MTVLFNSLTATCSSYSDSANVIWNISICYSFSCSSRIKLDAILCEVLPLFYRFIHIHQTTIYGPNSWHDHDNVSSRMAFYGSKTSVLSMSQLPLYLYRFFLIFMKVRMSLKAKLFSCNYNFMIGSWAHTCTRAHAPVLSCNCTN